MPNLNAYLEAWVPSPKKDMYKCHVGYDVQRGRPQSIDIEGEHQVGKQSLVSQKGNGFGRRW